jgi:two-component system LytT family response regulator
MQPVRVLIVDDEPLARAHLCQLLGEDGEVEVVGECGNGRDAVAAIRELVPELVLLDVQMPELDGFGVVREIGVSAMPAVVFVTAYDAYALQAFEVFALGYVLKPVDRTRLGEVLGRAKEAIRCGAVEDTDSRLSALLERMRARHQERDRLALKVEGRIVFVRTGEIDWIEAVDNHVRVHVGRTSHTVRGTLAAFEQRLGGAQFLRVHRSAIVNVARIAEVQPWFGGDHVIILQDGTRITSGRSYRQRLHDFLKRAL